MILAQHVTSVDTRTTRDLALKIGRMSGMKNKKGTSMEITLPEKKKTARK